MPVIIDIPPMDHSGSQKEGTSWTYKKFYDYAPIFSTISPHGFMLNKQLRVTVDKVYAGEQDEPVEYWTAVSSHRRPYRFLQGYHKRQCRKV